MAYSIGILGLGCVQGDMESRGIEENMKRYPRPGWVRILPTMPLKKLLNYNPKIHTEDEELVTTYWDEHEEELARKESQLNVENKI